VVLCLAVTPPPFLGGEASLVRGKGIIVLLQWLWE